MKRMTSIEKVAEDLVGDKNKQSGWGVILRATGAMVTTGRYCRWWSDDDEELRLRWAGSADGGLHGGRD